MRTTPRNRAINRCMKGPPMKTARFIVSALLVAAASMAQALEVKPYSAQTLAEAEKAGQPVALHFHANWCPTCRAQQKALDSMKGEKGLDLTVLTVNYDTEKDLKKRFNVRTQSTMVVLKGPQEVARLAGETSADGIRGALKAAL
jgi:thioredoxin 1